MRIAPFILACLAVTAPITAPLAAFDGFSVKFEGLPPAVQETAKAHMDNAFPVSITSAKGENGYDYQVNTRLNGKYHDLVINEQGKLVAVKDETDIASLPPAAKTAIEKEAASAKIMTVEKVTEGGQVSYGAIMKDEAQGKFVQVRVGSDGSVKSKE